MLGKDFSGGDDDAGSYEIAFDNKRGVDDAVDNGNQRTRAWQSNVSAIGSGSDC